MDLIHSEGVLGFIVLVVEAVQDPFLSNTDYTFTERLNLILRPQSHYLYTVALVAT